MKSFFNTQAAKSGFTLVEMVVVAPIVILAIGSFIAVIVSLTGEVLSSRGSNVLAYDVQDALNRIEEDVKLSSGFLARNSITFSTTNNPQGYGAVGSADDFTSVGGVSGTALILSTVATDGNPLATTSRMVYLANEPNSCSSYTEYSKNRPMVANIIYFVDEDGSLWRRTVMPYGYDNPAIRCGNAPWQQPSCQTGYVNSFCKTNDVRLVDGLGSGGLSISYYASANSSTADTSAVNPLEVTRKAALKSMQTVSVTIDATDTIAGRDIERSGSVRVTRLDTNATAIGDTVTLAAPAAPVVSGKVINGSSATFSWPRVASASSYALEYNINGGSWVTASALNSNDRTYSVLANHEDTVNVRVKAVNSVGQSVAYGTAAVQIPFWAPLTLNNSWTPFGSGYGSPEFSRTSSGLVVLKGMISKPIAAVGGEVIATLPPSYRPTAKLMIGIATATNASGRIDIDTNGDVILTTGNAGYVSLDSIRFMANNTGFSHLPSYTRTSLTGVNGWTNVGGVWATGSYVVDNRGRVVVQGVINTGTTTTGTQMATIPAAQRPNKIQILPTVSNTFSHYTSNNTNGLTARANGAGNFSINSFWFPTTTSPALTWNTIALQNSWVTFDTNNETAQYSITATENMVTIRGLISSGTVTDGTLLGTLPAGFRPEGRLVFPQVNNGTINRVDVYANGEIHIVGTAMSNVYQTLNAITFRADQ